MKSRTLHTLFASIRKALVSTENIHIESIDAITYNQDFSQVYLTLFQAGCEPIRWGCKYKSLNASINRIIFKLREHKNFSLFHPLNENSCKLLFEIVVKESPCNIKNLTTMRMQSPNRFEPGVNGLKYTYKGVTRFFMPTDGYTKSIMSVNQLLNYLSKQCGISKRTNKISQRVHLMRQEPIEYTFIESLAYLSCCDNVYKLNRAYPETTTFTEEIIFDRTIKSIDWLVKNMNEDGSFLYFYDPFKDTIIDDMHPKMINPLYNNILRHSGGTITLLRGYELTNNKLYLEKAKKSLEFLCTTFKTHTYNNEFACYPFFNKKSKLGGAGIGLVAFMHHYLHTTSQNFRKEIDGLVRHILSRIDKQGEMIGYYIHPNFNEGNPLTDVDDATKKELFSFYYPGEALLGLALYYLYMPSIDAKLKEELRQKVEMALDFLVDIRPIKYDYLFDALPADAWLMQAIEEWVKVDGLNKQRYIDFVFNDTKAMFDHMYKEDNTLACNKDYIGGFFYEYGDHVYHDASRCEGVVSAYHLAKYLGDTIKAEWIAEHMLLSAKGLMKTFYDEVATYPHKNPQKALHSFRFKLTRQWVRVDSVQHAACFFSRLLLSDLLKETENV